MCFLNRLQLLIRNLAVCTIPFRPWSREADGATVLKMQAVTFCSALMINLPGTRSSSFRGLLMPAFSAPRSITMRCYVCIHLSRYVVQLAEVLRYKPEGPGFDSRWCLSNFSLTRSFRPHYGPGFDSASNRNEYQ